jgi:hypothetical protein
MGAGMTDGVDEPVRAMVSVDDVKPDAWHDKQVHQLEELEDALKMALEVSRRIPNLKAASPWDTSGDNSEPVADALRRIQVVVADRLNVVYASEIRKKKGR